MKLISYLHAGKPGFGIVKGQGIIALAARTGEPSLKDALDPHGFSPRLRERSARSAPRRNHLRAANSQARQNPLHRASITRNIWRKPGANGRRDP